MGERSAHFHYCEENGNIVLDKRACFSALVGDDLYRITVWAGFECDGASIPRALWRLCGHPLQYPRVIAGIPHDWLYKAHITSRRVADAIFREILVDLGFPIWKAWVEWFALRLFGWFAWLSHDEMDNEAGVNEGLLNVNGQDIKP